MQPQHGGDYRYEGVSHVISLLNQE
jgi:hypothetical protein